MFGAGNNNPNNPNPWGSSTPTFGSVTTTASSVFGRTDPPPYQSAFGGGGAGGNVFGATAANTSSSTPGVSSSAAVFGAPATGAFGGRGTAITTTTASNPFLQSTSSASTTGFSTASSSNVFGNVSKPFSPASSNVFGASTRPFGQGSGSTEKGASVFGGATEKSTAVFGGATEKSTSVFGGATEKSTSVFGGATEKSASVFGGATEKSTSVFGGTTEKSTSVFGGATEKSTSVFGGATDKNASVFGGTKTFGSHDSAPASTGTGFGSKTATANVFGTSTNPTPSNASVFGGPKNTSASSVGPAPSSRTVLFGGPQPSSQPSSTSTLFGKASTVSTAGPTTTAAVFGGPPAPTGAFNNEPMSTVFGGKKETTSAADTTRSHFGKPDETKPLQSKVLFGKGVPADSTGDRGQEPVERNLFGKDAQKPKAVTGLFGKGDTDDKGTRESGRRVIQRLGVTGGARDQKRGGAGLFGRAIATVSEERERSPPPPRVGRRTVESSREEPEKAAAPVKVSPPGDGRSFRRSRSSVDDLSQFTVLVAKNVPATVNNMLTIRKHFSRFGKVKKVYCTPNKNTATVHFADHESALKAKKNGGIVRQGLPKLSLFWKALGAKTDVGSPMESAASAKPKSQSTEVRTSSERIPKKLFGARSEVNEELESMAGTQDVFGADMRPVNRPSGMQSDPLAGAIAQKPEKPEKSRGERRKPAVRSAVERVAQGSRREKARSVSPVNLPLKHPQDRAKDEAAKASREDSASPVPAAAPLVPMKSLIGKRCLTAQERIDVLDARDRLLREARNKFNKGKDLATARAIKGTCMDLCPEKERYLRQERRRLTQYEVHPESEGRGLVDHARVIKEYSRSSADQDMPLANELRPAEVLERTMTYILNNIIQLGGDNRWSDWYEFIWSRTRAIRKDITQQQLGDLTAVALVERCVRFHIYCAERLCEEDAAVFDMKINDENLTKCLQTLKEMYHDLATKHNQTCPNEAEFRAYMVLMNLNGGDILIETQQLRAEVRESPPVKFALSVYSALNSKNYIRFFKLVRRATYLNACILHRYFNQVRSQALLTMVMVYSLPGKTAQVPVTELVRLLGFEDEENVSMLCEHYGLPTENDCISMIKYNYVDPETALPPFRAQTLIESKLTTSAGEAMHGGPLPPNDILEPTSSFDSDGRFCPDAATLQIVQQTEEPDDVTESAGDVIPQIHTALDVPPPTPIETEADLEKGRHGYSNDSIKAVAKEIFIEVIEEICGEMSQNLVQTCHVFLSLAGPLTDQFVEEHIPQLTREVGVEVVEEEKAQREREARARAELSILRERAATQIGTDLLEETAQELTLEVAQEEKRDVDRELKEESQRRCTTAYLDDLLQTEITSEIHTLTQNFYRTEVLQKRQDLARGEQTTHLLRTKRYFQLWKNKLAVRQRLKRSMLDFPAAPSMETPQERLERLLPGSSGLCAERNAVHLGHNAWLTLAPPNVVVEKEKELIEEILRQNEEAKQKLVLSRSAIDLCKLIGPVLVGQMGERGKHSKGDIARLYWKLLLSLPQAETDEEEDYHDWLLNKLSTSDDDIPPELYNATAQVVGRSVGVVADPRGQPVYIHTAVRQMTGVISETNLRCTAHGRYLQATNAIMFVVSRNAERYQEWSSERRRLRQILSLFDVTKLSVVIASPANIKTASQRHLADLCQQAVYCKVIALSEDTINPRTTLQVQENLLDLAKNKPPIPALRGEWITDYLEHGLQRFFFSKLQNSVFSHSPEHFLNQVPYEMVELYNGSVVHLARVAADSHLQQVSWPPTEFSHTNDDLPQPEWNSGSSLQYLNSLITSLTVPPCHGQSDGSWADACSAVWDYVTAVASGTKGTDVFLVSRVRKLLQNSKESFEARCYWSSGVADAEPSPEDIPWSRVIKLCIDHKLAFLNTLDPDNNQNQLDYNEIRVYYDKDLMDAFAVPTEWLAVCRQSPDRSALETSIRRAVKRKQEEVTSQAQETSSKLTRVSPHEMSRSRLDLDLDPTEPELLEAQNMASELLGQIALEKKAMDSYEKYLEDILREGELPLPSVPSLHASLNSSFL